MLYYTGPHEELCEIYGTSKEASAGAAVLRGLVSMQLLERLHQHQLEQRRHAEELNQMFLALEARKREPVDRGFEHTRSPIFVRAPFGGSDMNGNAITSMDTLPMGWDEGMVRLASAAKALGKDITKTALATTTGAVPKMTVNGMGAVNPPAPGSVRPPVAKNTAQVAAQPAKPNKMYEMGANAAKKVQNAVGGGALGLSTGAQLAVAGAGALGTGALVKGTQKAIEYGSSEPTAYDNYRARISGSVGVPARSNQWGVALS